MYYTYEKNLSKYIKRLLTYLCVCIYPPTPADAREGRVKDYRFLLVQQQQQQQQQQPQPQPQPQPQQQPQPQPQLQPQLKQKPQPKPQPQKGC